MLPLDGRFWPGLRSLGGGGVSEYGDHIIKCQKQDIFEVKGEGALLITAPKQHKPGTNQDHAGQIRTYDLCVEDRRVPGAFQFCPESPLR